MPINRIVNPRLYKKNQKEIRESRTVVAAPIPPLPTRYPTKKAKKNVSFLISAAKNFEMKKAKNLSKRSKRANPDEVNARSPRASSHKEGKRWIKALRAQTSTQKTTSRKSSLKRGF